VNQGLRDYELGQEALSWMRNAFAQGKRLSSALSAREDLDRNSPVTYLPEGMQDETLHQFEFGKRLPWRTIAEHLVSYCTQFLETDARAVMLAEHAMARQNDPWVARSPDSLLFCDDEVYYYAAHESSRIHVEACCNAIFSAYPPAIAVLSRIPERMTLPVDGESISEDLISRIATSANVIFIGAYDGEGYIRWTSASS
jgi:hypothetical protein